MGKKDLEGQLNLFGNDPYQPKKAKANEEQVELSTEAEEFLSVGRRKKSAAPVKEEAVQAGDKTEEQFKPDEAEEQLKSDEAKTVRAKKKEVRSHHQEYQISMQQSFRDAAGKTATVAFVDYNCIYREDTEGNATLTHYPDAKIAVDHYLEAVELSVKTPGLKKYKDHPKLKKVPCLEWE